MKPNTEQYSIIDPVSPSLDDGIIQNNKVKLEVRNKILEASLKISEIIKIDINKVWLVGSSLTYQYTSESDIDVTLFVDKQKEELLELNKISSSDFNKKIFINKHPINFHFNSGSFFKFKADAIYDLKSDKWIKKPQSLSDSDVEELISGCASVKEFKEILQEYGNLKSLLKSFSGKSEQIKEIIDQTLKVNYLFGKIRDIRRDDFDKRKTNDLPSANFRCSNVIFKLLESYGLGDLASEISDFFIKRLQN